LNALTAGLLSINQRTIKLSGLEIPFPR